MADYLLDTNTIIRFAQEDNDQHELMVTTVDHLKIHGHKLFIVPQVIYEFYVVATRPIVLNGLGCDAKLADSFVVELTTVFTLKDDQSGIYAIWRDLVKRVPVKGKTAHDARLIAAMQSHGMTHLLTFNSADFRRYEPEIVVVDPAQVSIR